MVPTTLLIAGILAGQFTNRGWSAKPAAPAPVAPRGAELVGPPRLPSPAATVGAWPQQRPGIEGWPPEPAVAVRAALEAMNQRRSRRGAGPLLLDAGLSSAAQKHAGQLGLGIVQPHHGFPDRVRSVGWSYSDCGIRNHGFGNVSEGIAWGGETPAESVLILDDATDPREGHRQDFEDPAFTHVGIGLAPHHLYGHVAVVDYGARCYRVKPPAIPIRPSVTDAPQRANPPARTRPAPTRTVDPMLPPRPANAVEPRPALDTDLIKLVCPYQDCRSRMTTLRRPTIQCPTCHRTFHFDYDYDPYINVN